MGHKKRVPDSIEESSDQSPGSKITLKYEQKPKKQKSAKTEAETEANEHPLPISQRNLNPMERRKMRKALAKQRHRLTSENKEPTMSKIQIESPSPNQISLPSSSSSSALDLNLFSTLCSADLSVRETAAAALVATLKKNQKLHERRGDRGEANEEFKLEADKDDGLNNCAENLRYTIRRLVRGASSSRECARQGFALALAIIVGTIHSIKVTAVMKLIVDLIEIPSSMKGQEARECLLGRLFAYGALVRSGRMAEEWISDQNTSCIKEFVNVVLSLAAKKRYLREPAVAIILDLIDKLPVEAVSEVIEAPMLHEWFQNATEIGNSEALLLALRIREKIGTDNENLSKLLPYPFSSNGLFMADHLSSLLPCFKESTFCQPRLHSLWPVLVNFLLPDPAPQEDDPTSTSTSSSKKHKKSRKSNSSEEEISKNIRSFCEVVIEDCLLSSHDRKNLAFEILLLLLPRLPISCVSIVFSHKLVNCLMDILSTQESWLYKAAQHFLKELSSWIGENDDRRVPVIVALQKHSCGRFDSVTRLHTVKDLVTGFKTGSGCMLFAQNLMNMFVDEGPATDEPSDQSHTTDENSEMGYPEDKDLMGSSSNPDSLKSWIIDSLPRLSKNLRLDSEAKSWMQKEIMKFLAVQGLFSASLGTEVTSFELQEKFKWPKVPTSSALCRTCIEQLQLVLADDQKGEGTHFVLNGFEPSDLGAYFMRFLGTLCNIPSVSLFRQLSMEDEKAFKNLQAMEARLLQEERNIGPGADAKKIHVLRYLLIQLLLQVILRPGDFSEAASELVICCKKAFSTPNLLDSSGEEDEFDDNGAPELMDVLVDTLLSLLPQSSAPMCFAVEQVFRLFCDEITDEGLLQMLRVIKKDLKSGRHKIMDDGEYDDDDDGDDDLLAIEDAEEDIEEEEEAEVVDTGDSDDHVEESKAQVDKSSGDHSGSDEESDSGMDDDAMFRMDSYLTRIFKERKSSSGNETAQSQLVLFKLRVLSLLEIYLQRNPGKPQVITVFSSLVQAFVNSHLGEGTEQLGQRIGGILQRKLFRAKEYPKSEEIQISILESLLEKSLKSASRSRHKLVSSLAQNSTFWILKIVHARNLPESELHKVLEVFQHVLVDYFDCKKCRLKSGFVKEAVRRHPWLGHALFGFLLEKCGNAKSEYRRIEALYILDEILKSCVPSKKDGENASGGLTFLESHLYLLGDFIGKLLTTKPEKQSRRTEVRKFCARTLQVIQRLNLNESFVKGLNQEAYAACESQLGDLFLPFKRLGK